MIKHTILKTASLFAAATAASFIFSSAAPAHAARAVVPASACWVDSDYIGDYLFSSGIANNSGGVGARARRVVCPVPDYVNNLRSGIGTLYLDGYDGDNGVNANDSVQAYVCVTQYGGLGMLCSPTTFATSGTYTGVFDTPISASAITMLQSATYADWYTSLVVQLPQTGVAGQSQFYGFTTF